MSVSNLKLGATYLCPNNFLTIVESIYKLFCAINWKLISINHSNSFKVKNKLLKWDVTYACLKHLKTSWIYEKFVRSSTYFLLLFSVFVQLLQSLCMYYICFSTILLTQILPLSTETGANNLHIQYLKIHFSIQFSSARDQVTTPPSPGTWSQHPPPPGQCADGQYASYWNAFLFARDSFSFMSISLSFCSFQSFLLISFPPLFFPSSSFFLYIFSVYCLNWLLSLFWSIITLDSHQVFTDKIK